MRLESLDRDDPDANKVYMNVLFSTVPQAQTAFDTTSGEIYASLLSQAGTDGIARARRLIARSHEVHTEGLGVWGGVSGRTGSLDGDGNAAKVDAHEFGFDFGVDYRGQDNRWALGASGGYVDGQTQVDDRLSRAKYDGWHLGAYGRVGSGGPGLTVSGAIDYTKIEASVSRGIVVNTLNRMAWSDAGIRTVSLSGEVRYGVAVGKDWSIGPVASIHHASAKLGRISETGANALNLTSDGGKDKLTRYGGGLAAHLQSDKGSIDVSAQYVDGPRNSAWVPLVLQGAPDASFPVSSPRTDGGAGLFTISGHHTLGGGWTVSGEARALAGKHETSVAGSVTVGLTF